MRKEDQREQLTLTCESEAGPDFVSLPLSSFPAMSSLLEGLDWGLWGDLAFLGVDALCAMVLYSVYRRKEKLIKNILEAPSLSVGSELLEMVEGRGGEVKYAVIRGRVKDLGQTIESSSGLKTVMQRVTLNEHSYRRSALNHWGDNVRTIHQAENSVPFSLSSLSEDRRGTRKGFTVGIDNPFDADDESLFLTSSTTFTPTTSSVASTVMGFFTGVAVRGVERTEEVLPVDTVVTGIGRLLKEADGQVKLVVPSHENHFRFILSTLPVESVIKKLEGRSTVLKTALFVVAAVGMVIAVRRLRLVWKERKLRKMRELILRQRQEIDTAGLADCQICTVCLVNPREVILLDCGHVCVCADCCIKLNSKCPVCRSVFISSHPAYIV